MWGGFPELHANPEIDTAAFYNSYIATYLERDVRSISNVGSLRGFERFLRACALRSGNLLNKADLARDIGISPSTANQRCRDRSSCSNSASADYADFHQRLLTMPGTEDAGRPE